MNWIYELANAMHSDAYAQYTGREKSKYVKVDAPLTTDVIDKHLSGDQPVAAYALSNPDGNKGRVVVFDFDDHDGTLPEGHMEAFVEAFLALFKESECPYIVVRSGGGKGYHVWMVFETEKRKDVLRGIGTKTLEALDKKDLRSPERDPETGKFKPLKIKEGPGGVAKGEIEIFPKSDGKGGLHAIALPLARNSIRMGLDERGKLVEAPDDDSLPLMKGIKPGPRKKSKSTDRDAAFDALAAKLDPADYDQWIKFGHMLIATFGKDDPWAFEHWAAWSATASNADPDGELRAKWDRGLTGDPRYSPATFWFEARDAGYDGPMPFGKKDEQRLALLESLGDIEMIRSPDGEIFAGIGPRQYVYIRSRAFEAYLRRRALEDGQMLSGEIIKQVVETVAALAYDSEVKDIHLRFAADGDRRYLFLADDACTVIEIDADGWRPCEAPPVRFRKGDGRALPTPQNGTLEDLRRFVNIDEDNLPFYLAWIASCILRPGLAAPIAVLTGPAGSAKSTLLQLTVDLLDPKAGATAGMPKNEDDLVVAAHNGAIVSFDNATTLATMSDELCRLSTGGGLRKRTLYTDSEVTALDVKRPVMVSGIDPTVYRQDLIERLLVIELHPPVRRIDDETLADEVDEARPRLLGYILSLVSQVLAMGAVEASDTRLIGFAKIGEAVARILGHDAGWFSDEYAQMLQYAADEAADSDCVVQLIRQMVANENSKPNGVSEIRHTSQGLLDQLEIALNGRSIIANKADIPQNSRTMSSRVRRVITTLRGNGINIDQIKRDRMWIITQNPPDHDEAEKLLAQGDVMPM